MIKNSENGLALMSKSLSSNQFVDQPYQTTVKDVVSFEGIGLHSGRFSEVSILPAPANSGINFCRTDVETMFQTIPAHANFAEQARLCTRIVNDDGIGLDTIEHIMAAFAGIGLDNAVVEINAPEAPILDGSSAPYLVALQNVGLEKLPVARKFINIIKPITVTLEDGSWAKLSPA